MLKDIFELLYATSIFTMSAFALLSSICKEQNNETYSKLFTKYMKVNLLVTMGATLIIILINY